MKVFLSYAKEDGAIVKEFHDYLKGEGFDPWMDQERLLPGQSWEREIDRALQDANVVILFMSPRSVQKRSFVTREANMAVDNLRYKKADDIYIIPALIEPCEVPEEIARRAQYIQISEPGAKEKIVSSIKRAAEQQKIALVNGVEHGPYRVFSRSYEERKSGQPGHDIALQYPSFTSATLPHAAESLSRFFQGRATHVLLDSQSKPWAQDPDYFPAPDVTFSSFHSNGRWEHFGIASATEHLVSVHLACSWYGAGAAHENQFHEGINFAIRNDRAYPFTLPELFANKDRAAKILSLECRRSLEREYWNRTGAEMADDDYWRDTFLSSTSDDLSNFDCFTVSDGKLSFYFAPYTVAAFAVGSFTIDVPLYDLRDVLAKEGKSPLVRER